MSLFREIAKQVHPDVNGGSSEFTKRMQEVLANRNNQQALLNLARKWGLKLDGSFDDAAFNARSYTERTEEVFEAVVGAIVRYSFNHNRRMVEIRGVITSIRAIQKGNYAGAKEYTIYNFRDGRIWRHKSFSTPGFLIVGLASEADLRMGKEVVETIKKNQKNRKKAREDHASQLFREVGLSQNKNYVGYDREVLVNYRGGSQWKRLVRTTKQCVYVNEYGRERRVNIRHILKVGV